MKCRNYFIAAFLIASFFYGQIGLASSFLILGVQTTGAGGAYDEFVKIQNNTGQTINLLGYRLQSQGSSGGNWTNRTGTDGLPSLTVGPNQIFIIASKDYGGNGEIYRHTARWGLSDTAGGIRFLNAEGNVLTEEHWTESPGLVVLHETGTSTVSQPIKEDEANGVSEAPHSQASEEAAPAVEPTEPADSAGAEVVVVPEEQTPAVIPSEERVEESQTSQEADVISPLPPPAAAVGRNDVVKTASAQGESVLAANLATPSPITEIKKLKNDSKVTVRGVVSVPPGVLGSQIFYLSGSGIQVYMFKKDFLDLKVGDVIEINGALSEAYGEKRIKLASRDSIKLVSRGEAPAPREIAAREIGESMEGSLVKIGGEIIEVKKDSWYLADGDKEVKILLKGGANIPADLVKPGDQVEITGIVSQYNKEYRLLPRSIDDIKILEKSDASAAVASETTNSKEAKKGFGVKDYLFVGMPIMFLVGLIIFRRKISKPKKENGCIENRN